MIYDADKGDRGKVFSNGVEVDRMVIRVDTETGECVCSFDPMKVENGKLITETIFLENVTVEPL
jgi:hypothetical protein